MWLPVIAFSLRAARGEGGRRPDEECGRPCRRRSPLTPALSPCAAKGEGDGCVEPAGFYRTSAAVGIIPQPSGARREEREAGQRPSGHGPNSFAELDAHNFFHAWEDAHSHWVRQPSPLGRRPSPPGRRLSPLGRRAAPVGRRSSPPGRRPYSAGRRPSPLGRRPYPTGRRASPAQKQPTRRNLEIPRWD